MDLLAEEVEDEEGDVACVRNCIFDQSFGVESIFGAGGDGRPATARRRGDRSRFLFPRRSHLYTAESQET